MRSKRNIHGIISLLLIVDSLGIGLLVIFGKSLLWAAIYLATIINFFILVSLVYCSKCACRNNCNHIIPGKLSRMLKKPSKSNYTIKDILFGVIIPLLPVLIIPQFFLIENLVYLFLFWILLVIAGVEIILCVCKRCANKECPVQRKAIKKDMVHNK